MLHRAKSTAKNCVYASVMVLAVALSGITLFAEQPKTQRIAVADLKKKLDRGDKFLLIDVREDWEIKLNGAIPNSIHIPVAELDNRMADIPKDVEIVFYCAGGTRAEAAAEKFIKAGYKAGEFCGISDWKKENQKVVDKEDRPAAGPIRPKS